jgi:Rrf2 family protein
MEHLWDFFLLPGTVVPSISQEVQGRIVRNPRCAQTSEKTSHRALTYTAADSIIETRLKWSEIRMLKLTKKADYGLIALKHLAVNARGGSASTKDIAEMYGIPSPLLAKILQKLARSGFLQSEQGTHGGYRLARSPKEITTLEVVRAIDGPIILTACFTEHGECSHSDKCTVREPLRKVHEGILRLLNSITISDLSHDGMELPVESLFVPGPLAGACAPARPVPSAHKL